MTSPIESEYSVVKTSEGDYAIMHVPSKEIKLENLKRHDLLWLMHTAANWVEKDELDSPASSNPKN